jgi:hypothetical protein
VHDRECCDATVPTRAPSHLPECVCWPSSAPGRGLSDASRFDTCGLGDLSSSLQSSALHSVVHERECCGATVPTRAPSHLPEWVCWPSSAPDRGLNDAPRVDTCGLGDFSSSLQSSVLHSVVHDRECCGATVPTRAPSHLPECVCWPPSAPDRGPSDAPRFDTCGRGVFSSSLQSSVLHSVVHDRECWDATVPTRAPSHLPKCVCWPSSAPDRGLSDAPRFDTCGMGDFSSSLQSSVLLSAVQDRERCGATVPTRAPSHLPERVCWPSSAPDRGLSDAPRVDTCGG